MDRFNKIIKSDKYKKILERVSLVEQDRIYCLHNFEHSCDVARIMYITALEKNIPIPKEIIYTTAFLHDIGRIEQYKNSTPHEVASVEMSKEFLADFNTPEQDMILCAISEHRSKGKRSALGEMLSYADTKSRMCLNCKAISTCKWRADEMNMEVLV